MEYITLKPNRDLLNAKFESYHLGPTTLEVKQQSLLQPVAFHPLTEEHYSYAHLRAHATQNLLTLDPWNTDEDILYFVDDNFGVTGITFDKDTSTYGPPVSICKLPAPTADKNKDRISPSITFPSPEECLFNDGKGKLYMAKTRKRQGSLEKQNWHSNDVALVKDFGFPFYLHHSCCDEQDNMFCMLVSLEDEKNCESSHPKVSLHLLNLVQSSKGSNSAQDQVIIKSTSVFHGKSFPLYASYSPDFNGVIVASQDQFVLEDNKDPGDTAEEKNGEASCSSGKERRTSETVVLDEQEAKSGVYTEQIEECDMDTEEEVKLVLLDKKDGSIKLETPVSGHQWLFNKTTKPSEPASFCLRHDVDGILWKPVTDGNNAKLSWKHISTFNALGFIQASKKNHKYTVCGAENGFVAIIDCLKTIYVYFTEKLDSKDGSQYVLELPTFDEILGVQANKDTLFLMTKNSLFSVKVI